MRLRIIRGKRAMDDLIRFVGNQLTRDRVRAGAGPGLLEVEFKQTVFDLHRPRYDGNVWVCDGCTRYDTIRMRPIVVYAPCSQMEALARVFTYRPGFDPGWIGAEESA
jgi:hypothetical protein